MTQRLYYDDAYRTEFDAQVLACIPQGEQYRILLDQSAFYPTSGGQPYDTGMLGGVRVLDVNVEDGEVWHTAGAPLTVGETVHGVIDWPRRFDHMQQHAGDHMIAGALHRMLGGVTIGLHTGDEVSTIDVAMPGGRTRLTEEEIARIELDVNEHIQRDVPIRCWFPSEAELKALPLRKKPTVTEHVRVVAIGDDEMVACGGTHPSSAGQVGLVKILSTAPARGKMRVTFLAGLRAYRDYQVCRQAAHDAADRFSTGIGELNASVAALQERLRAAEGELVRMRRERLLSGMEDMLREGEPLPGGGILVAKLLDEDAQTVRELASKLIERPGVAALLGARSQDRVAYVFARSQDGSIDMGALLRDCAKPLGGKGGGKPDFAQGGGCEAILDAARAALMR